MINFFRLIEFFDMALVYAPLNGRLSTAGRKEHILQVCAQVQSRYVGSVAHYTT